MRFDQAIENVAPVCGFFAKLAVGMLAMLALSLATGGCVGPQRVANLEGQVEGLKVGLGQTTATANAAFTAAKAAQGTADHSKAEAAQANRVATEAHNMAGRAQAGVAGLQTVTQEHTTGLAEYREFRKNTMEPLMRRVDGHDKKFRALQGDEPAPNISGLVAGPGAPKLPSAITKQEGPFTLVNPSAAQIKKALEDDERPRNEVRLYGPTDEARQKVFDGFRATLKQAGFDPNTVTPRSLNATSARVEIDFGPIPDTVKAARTAPKP